MGREFTEGQRVVVKEGYPGTVVHEHVGIDTTSYYVLLDDGQGEGWWAENEMEPTTLQATAAHTAEVARRMASDSYPELVGALEERPDLERILPEAEYMKSLTRMALYLPIDGPIGGKGNRSQGYQDGYEQGKHASYQQPARTDAEYMAEFHLGWAMGVRERGGPEPAFLTSDLGTDDPNLPEMKFDPDMGPGWLRSASLATEAGFVDFLMGSPEPSETWAGPGRNWSYDACFLPDAPVTMADGTETPICEITPGDEVLTHLGNVRTVVEARPKQFTGRLARVSVFSDLTREIVATDEHPFWVRRQDGTVGWVPLGEVREGDYLSRSVIAGEQDVSLTMTATPRAGWGRFGRGVSFRPEKTLQWLFTTPSPRKATSFATLPEAQAASAAYHAEAESLTVLMDEDMAWLTGLYAGDGFIPNARKGHAVRWSLHEDETDLHERVIDIVRSRFGVTPAVYPESGRRAVAVVAHHWALRQWMDHMVGRGSHTKSFSAEIMTLPVSLQHHLIEGYMDADGYHRKDGGHNLTTVSVSLARQVRDILARMGTVCSIRWNASTKEHGYEGQTPSLRVEWWDGKNHLSRNFIEDGQVWQKVTSVEVEDFEGEVWDIEVEGDHSFRAFSMNVHNCRFRRESHCWLPRELNREASDLAGYAVWVPEDRGHCRRVQHDDQRACPLFQPGPNEPGGFTDATVSWEAGGQRGGVPTEKIAATQDGFAWHYTAAWSDVQAKGKEIYDSGRVRVLAVNMQDDGLHPDTFYGQVQSTTGEVYEPGLEFVPGTFQLATWVCTCDWNKYVWGRTRQWVKYEGRVCSHALALIYQMQSSGMSGIPDAEDAIAPDWIPKAGSKVTREDFPVVQALLDTGASVAAVQAALHRAGVETAKTGVKGTFRGKINGQVHTLDFEDGKVFLMGRPYDGPILYPEYDRTLGLTASKQEDDMPINPDHMAFSVTASKGNDILGYVAYPEKKSEAQVQYANTPSYDEDSVPRGKNVHLGGGLWIRRCSQCDDYIKTWGQSPLWQPEFTAHLNAHGLDTSLAPLHSSVRDWQPGDDVMIGGNLWEVTGVGDDWLKVVPLDTYPDGAKIIAKPAPGEPLAIKPAPGRRDTTASVDKTAAAVFSRAEQDEIINEGEGSRAQNLASLDLTGTHYVPLEDLVADPNDDPYWLW